MPAELDDPLVGSMLGKDYRVLAPIGIGGMAVVYLVEHQTLLKQFAAKVLSPALASSLEARARFAQEAHAASQLDHENIVTISDFGVTVDHRPFFVMELLRGQTLDQRLAEGRMTIEEVVAVSVPVARALAHAHAEGLVHLDVKPENIFLVQRSQGRWGVKVVDFGIAKTPNATIGPLTPLDETSGSPMFMAPETCRGDAQIDQRADVYSFGILLYLMMCGRLPFVDDSVQRVLQMQLVQLPAPPRELNADLTPEVAAIVERALAKRPEDRYPTMAALMRDLEAALPPGSDRLLIEAASGTTMGGTPFAGALSGLQRPSQQIPVAAIPAKPSRRGLPIVAVTAVAVTLIGVLLWRQFGDSAASSARVAQAGPTAPLHAEAAPPPTRLELEVEPVAHAAKPDEVPIAEAASDATPASARPAESATEPTEPAIPAPAPATTATPSGARDPLLGNRIAARAVPRREAIALAAHTISATVTEPTTPDRAPPVVAPEPAHAAAPSAAQVAIEAAPTPAPELVPPAAPPVAPPPSVMPPPATPVAVKPPPVPRGSLDAIPTVVSLEVKGSLSPAIVRRSMERTLGSLRACYRTAARASNTTPAVELRLAFEVDENSLATHVATSGAGFGSLAGCVAGVAGQIRTQEAPDVGTAQVTVVIGFRPS